MSYHMTSCQDKTPAPSPSVPMHRLRVHRAVATALVVIALVSTSGVTASVVAGRPLALMLAGLFVSGGIAGMGLGTRLSRKLSGPSLQKGFAVALALVAAFIITKSVI